jgi:hypothetical protein
MSSHLDADGHEIRAASFDHDPRQPPRGGRHRTAIERAKTIRCGTARKTC